MARKEWFSSQELAGLPGMPLTYSAVLRWAQKNLTPCRSKPRGKGLEYARASLPAETREFLDQRDLAEAITQLPAELIPMVKPVSRATGATSLALVPVVGSVATVEAGSIQSKHPSPSLITERALRPEADRQIEFARTVAVRAMQEISRHTGCSPRAAAIELMRRYTAGELPAGLAAKMSQSRAKQGRKARTGGPTPMGFPSLPTLYRWLELEKTEGTLLPKVPDRELVVRAWYAPFYALADGPQQRTRKKAWELLLQAWRPEWEDPPGSGLPGYEDCLKAYNMRSEIDKIKGQHTGSALKAKTFYYRRTYEGLPPFSEVHADGWNTHFTAPDENGKFRTYEVWHARCVATKYVPPFAVGYTETTDLILQCVRNAVEAGGLIAIFQTDSTKAVKGNARVMDELTGVEGRLGLTFVHPQEVGNSQANGMAENFNTWLDREARELATYQNPKVMDERTFVRMKRITNQMAKDAAAGRPQDREAARQLAIRTGKGIVFDTRPEALKWLEDKRQKWNNHPHRSLPKIVDPLTGRKRHMTPQESLDAALAAGWQPQTVPAELLHDAFRPHLVKKVTRGTVTPFGGMRYRHPALDALMNQEVQVAVEPEDFSRVWVKDLKGQLLCVAEHVPDVQGRSQSFREVADTKRAQARIKLREKQIEAIEQEIAPPPYLEMDTPAVVIPANFGQPREAEVAPVAESPMEVYLRRRVAEQQVKKAQEELDAIARAEAALAQPNPNETGDERSDDPDFESAAG